MYIVIETCDENTTANLLTSNEQKARRRLFDLAVENEVIKESASELKSVLAGTITAYRVDDYTVEILEAEDEDDDTAKYAEVFWTPEDVQTLRENLSFEDAEAFLERNEGHLAERLTEVGWEVIETFLSMEKK